MWLAWNSQSNRQRCLLTEIYSLYLLVYGNFHTFDSITISFTRILWLLLILRDYNNCMKRKGWALICHSGTALKWHWANPGARNGMWKLREKTVKTQTMITHNSDGNEGCPLGEELAAVMTSKTSDNAKTGLCCCYFSPQVQRSKTKGREMCWLEHQRCLTLRQTRSTWLSPFPVSVGGLWFGWRLSCLPPSLHFQSCSLQCAETSGLCSGYLVATLTRVQPGAAQCPSPVPVASNAPTASLKKHR